MMMFPLKDDGVRARQVLFDIQVGTIKASEAAQALQRARLDDQKAVMVTKPAALAAPGVTNCPAE